MTSNRPKHRAARTRGATILFQQHAVRMLVAVTVVASLRPVRGFNYRLSGALVVQHPLSRLVSMVALAAALHPVKGLRCFELPTPASRVFSVNLTDGGNGCRDKDEGKRSRREAGGRRTRRAHQQSSRSNRKTNSHNKEVGDVKLSVY